MAGKEAVDFKERRLEEGILAQLDSWKGCLDGDISKYRDKHHNSN